MIKTRNEATYQMVSRCLKVLADPSRLLLLDILCQGEKNVTRMVDQSGLSQANVSRHLSILRGENIVSTRREHRKVYYRLNGKLSQRICRLVCDYIEQRVALEDENSSSKARRSLE